MDLTGPKEFKFEELPQGATLIPRSAKALTGLEVSEAIAAHVAETVNWREMKEIVLEKLRLDGKLNKEHLTYPRVSWEGQATVWRYEDGTREFSWSVNIWTDSVRFFNLNSGTKYLTGDDVTAVPVSFSQARTDKPDEIRRRFGLAVTTKARLKTGQTVTVILPANTEFGASGVPTAAAARMKALAEGREIPTSYDAKAVDLDSLSAVETREYLPLKTRVPGLVPATEVVPATELVAEPPPAEAVNPVSPGAPGSIAKKPPASLGKLKGRK